MDEKIGDCYALASYTGSDKLIRHLSRVYCWYGVSLLSN